MLEIPRRCVVFRCYLAGFAFAANSNLLCDPTVAANANGDFQRIGSTLKPASAWIEKGFNDGAVFVFVGHVSGSVACVGVEAFMYDACVGVNNNKIV